MPPKAPVFPKWQTNRVVIALNLGLLALILIAVWGYGVVKREMKHNLEQHLQATLTTNMEAVDLWWQDKIKDAQVLAQGHGIHQNILSLVKKTNGEEWPATKLLNIPEAKFLQEQLRKASAKYGFIGFVLFDRNSYQLLALLNGATGTHTLVKKNDFPKRALAGQPLVTLPFKSEIPLPDIDGTFHPDFPTMFVAVPIQNTAGEVVAVLAFRIRPEIEFNRLMTLSHFGETGETYAFDKQGLLLTESRFYNHLKAGHLMDPPQAMRSMLNVQLRNPGGNPVEGFVPRSPRSEQPLTLMAQSATSGQSGVNTEGYRDYRGVEVVGAWAWREDKGFGMATEVDANEAFAPLNTLILIFASLFSLLFIALFALTKFYIRKVNANKILEEQKKLNEQKDRLLGTLADNVVDAVITIDQRGIMQSFNPAAERIFGYHKSEVIGKNVNTLMDGENREQHDQYLLRYMRTWEPRIIGIGREVVGLKKDGSHFHLDLSVSQHWVGTELWFTGICRDITERKNQEMETEKARREAEEANRAKSQFLARMSHELRTPMNAILGFGQLLAFDPATTQNQKNSVDQILNSGGHLLALINDILDLSRIETDDISLSPEAIAIPPLIDQMIFLIDAMSVENNIKIVNEIPDTLPHKICGDLTRVKQIILNLMTNAIKYNRENGQVTLTCNTVNDQHIEISVTDTGFGIPENQMHKLFKPFERLGAENSPVAGTGIGLAISHDLAHKMGGDLFVESKANQGSRFTLRLPVAATEVESPERFTPVGLPETQPSAHNGQSTILYIEDNISNLNLVSQILKNQTHISLVTAGTAKEGLETALEKTPDLILLDIDLPDMNGLDLFRQMQAMDATRHIPVLGLSANAMEKDIQKALNLGLQDYITKPLDVSHFLKTIFQHLPATK